MTGEQSHFACIEGNPGHLRTPRARLKRAGSQRHLEVMLMMHLQVRLSDRPWHLDCYPHFRLPMLDLLDAFLLQFVTTLIMKNSKDQAQESILRHNSISLTWFPDRVVMSG